MPATAGKMKLGQCEMMSDLSLLFGARTEGGGQWWLGEKERPLTKCAHLPWRSKFPFQLPARQMDPVTQR